MVILLLMQLVVIPQQENSEVLKLTGQFPNPENALESQVQRALEKMQQAAQAAGIQIKLVSGYRSFDKQVQIWNRKYDYYAEQALNADAIFDKIVAYSTVPGTSRHHWGTDVDLVDGAVTAQGDLLVATNFEENGPFYNFKLWMDQHASSFGFEQAYTLNDDRPGFAYEPWHYSYVSLSRKRYHDYLTQIDVLQFLRGQNIKGLKEISDERLLRYKEEHIKGINPVLKK